MVGTTDWLVPHERLPMDSSISLGTYGWLVRSPLGTYHRPKVDARHLPLLDPFRDRGPPQDHKALAWQDWFRPTPLGLISSL